MAELADLDGLARWADKVAQESSSLSPDLSEEELRDHEATWYAEFYSANSGWTKTGADDPGMRDWLTVEEGMSPELADAVVAKMSDAAAAR